MAERILHTVIMDGLTRFHTLLLDLLRMGTIEVPLLHTIVLMSSILRLVDDVPRMSMSSPRTIRVNTVLR